MPGIMTRVSGKVHTQPGGVRLLGIPTVLDRVIQQAGRRPSNDYGLTESFNRLRPLPHWIRRRLRALVWKHWKNRKTRVGELLKRGVSRNYAVTTGCARKGPWRMSKVKWVNIALPDDHFKSLGLSFPWI